MSWLDKKLVFAAKTGDSIGIRFAAQDGADLERTGLAALCNALENGHLECVRVLLGLGVNLGCCTYLSSTVVIALRKGYFECVKALFDSGFCLDFWHEALKACPKKHINELFQLLLHQQVCSSEAYRFSLNDGICHAIGMKSSKYFQALFKLAEEAQIALDYRNILNAAIENTCVNIVAFLLEEYGLAFTEYVSLALCNAADHNANLSIVRLLLKNGADIHTQKDYALRKYAAWGNITVLVFLLKNNADVHAGHEEPLRIAVARGRAECVRLFIDAGANVREGDDAALRAAIEGGHTEIAEILLDAGSGIRSFDGDVLLEAAAQGRYDILQLLLEHNVDIHFKHDAPLRWAAIEGHVECIELLLRYGADSHALEDIVTALAEYKGEFKADGACAQISN